MDSILARALRECSLENGVLSVEGLSKPGIRKLNDELREALLGCKIPHYKVFGVNVITGGVSSTIDYVTKLDGVNKSYTELLVSFDDLVFSEAGDNWESEVQVLKEWGHLMAVDNVITSTNGTIFYAGKGMGNTPEALVKDVDIVKFTKANCVLHLVTRRGTGMHDFPMSETLLRGTEYKPIRAVYDLNGVFSIKLYEENDNAIYLYYKKSVNEGVLQRILQDFANNFIE